MWVLCSNLCSIPQVRTPERLKTPPLSFRGVQGDSSSNDGPAPKVLTHNKSLFTNMLSKLKKIRARGYKSFFIFNSAERKIYPAYKCKNANKCWHFNIY